MTSVSDANVTLFSDKGGIFSPKTGKTNSTGYLTSMFIAPTVVEDTMVTISAIATKTECWNGQDQIEINVLPRDVTTGIDFSWVLAAIVLAIILIVSVFGVKVRKDRNLALEHSD